MQKAITRIQAVLVIVIMLAIVAAGAYFATPKGPTNVTTQSAVSVPNADTITYDTIVQPDTLDPASDYSTCMIMCNVYEPLVWFKGEHTDIIVPWLAQGYDISSDGLTYTFHLRSGITFSDGTAFNASAVYFSLMRTLIIDDPNSAGWTMDQIVRGAANYSKSYNNAGPSAPNGYGDKYTQAELNDFLNAKPIEVIDPMTVAIHLEHPTGSFLSILTYEEAFIDSPSAIIAHWTAPTDGTPHLPGITAGDYHGQYNPWPETHPVGTGPYVLTSWDKGTQTEIMARNENYWGGPYSRGLAPVKNIIIRNVNDPNTRLLDLKGGQADVIFVPTSSTTIFDYADKNTWLKEGKLVSTNPDIQVYPQCPPETPIAGKCSWPTLATVYMGFNQFIRGLDGKPQAFQPFSDIRIRKAFTLAFDRDTFIQNGLLGLGSPATQILPPTMFGYDPTIQETPFDLNTAKQLLIDAGTHPLTPDNAFSPQNPKTIQITYELGNTPRETAITVLANGINSLSADTGLYVEVVGMSYAQLISAEQSGQVVYIVDWEVDYPDPDDFIVPFGHATAGSVAHRVSYVNMNVTNLIDQETATVDPAQRTKLISQIEHVVNNDYAYLWIYYSNELSVSRTWLQERANASLASHISAYNAFSENPYFYEIQKGPPMTSPGITSFIQLLIAETQLTAASSITAKKN